LDIEEGQWVNRRVALSALGVVALTGVLWLIDAAIHAAVFGHGTFAGELVSPPPDMVFARFALLSVAVLAVLLALSIGDARAARRDAEEERRHVLMLYDNTTDAIMFIDREMRIVYVNRVAERLGGKRLVDAIGWPCHQAILGSAEPCAGCRAREVLEGGQPCSAVKHEITESGNENWLEQKWYPVMSASGELDGVLEVARDITEVKLLEREAAECRRGEDTRRRAAEHPAV
jgi:PAS domain S-box-containing protein